MKVAKILNQNQAYVECPTCGKETLYQKTEMDWWFCSNDFRRTHVVEHSELFPPESKAAPEKPKSTPAIEPVPEERPMPMDTILSRRAEIVAEVPELAYFQPWTVRVGGGRSVCRSCSRPSHYKPGEKCKEPRHIEAYLFSLHSKAQARYQKAKKPDYVEREYHKMERKAGILQNTKLVQWNENNSGFSRVSVKATKRIESHQILYGTLSECYGHFRRYRNPGTGRFTRMPGPHHFHQELTKYGRLLYSTWNPPREIEHTHR